MRKYSVVFKVFSKKKLFGGPCRKNNKRTQKIDRKHKINPKTYKKKLAKKESKKLRKYILKKTTTNKYLKIQKS